jgi:putative peptidoglycan lipid II flippase
VAIGIGSMALNVLLSLTLRGPLGYAGLALANTLATSLEMALLLWLLARRLGGLDGSKLWSTTLRAGLAAAALALPLQWAAGRWSHSPALLVGAAGLVAGAAIYLAATVLLRMEELQVMRQIVKRKT